MKQNNPKQGEKDNIFIRWRASCPICVGVTVRVHTTGGLRTLKLSLASASSCAAAEASVATVLWRLGRRARLEL